MIFLQISFVHENVFPFRIPVVLHALHRFDVPRASTSSTAMPARRASNVARAWTCEKNYINSTCFFQTGLLIKVSQFAAV